MKIEKAIDSEISSLNRDSKNIYWNPSPKFEFQLTIPPTVYPPKEDTNLIAEYLLEIGQVVDKKLIEIGCGSGAISILASKLGWNVHACDINPYAVIATRGNADSNGSENITVTEGGIGPEVGNKKSRKWYGEGNADLIIWNLPYLSPDHIENGMLGPLEDAALIDFTEEGEGLSKHLRNAIQKTSFILKPNGKIFLLHSNNTRGNNLQRIWRREGWSTRTLKNSNIGSDEILTLFATWRPWNNRGIHYLDSIDSTNKFALNENLSNGSLVVAKKQTGGRGRKGKSWEEITESFKGTWLLNTNIESPSIMQCKASLAVIDSISTILDEEIPSQSNCIPNRFYLDKIGIKWPNDLVYRKRKFGGILIQSITKGGIDKVAIGIGINCGIISENDLRDYSPGSLHEITNYLVEMDEFSRILDASISSLFETNYLLPKQQISTLFDTWFKLMRDSTENGRYRIGKHILTRPIGIDSNGHLIVQETNGNQIKPISISDLDAFSYLINQ